MEDDDIFKFFDELDENKIDINYKDSLLANLFSQIDFLRNEIKEKNFIIRNLLERIKTSKCVIFPNVTSGVKDLDMLIETSTICSDANDFQIPLIDLSEDASDQNEKSTISSHADTFINSNKSPIIENELYNNEQNNTTELYNQRINQQLKGIRQTQHDDYKKMKENVNETQNVRKWSTGTVLIAADSICNNLDEKRIGRNNRVKVRCFPGATINDMYHYLQPLLDKQPDHIILHISTNDAILKTSEEILTDLLQLKSHIESTLPSCNVIISEPIMRCDNGKANITIKHLIEKLRRLNIRLLYNGNITKDHLSKKGLHLNMKGTGRLALNIITYIRQL